MVCGVSGVLSGTVKVTADGVGRAPGGGHPGEFAALSWFSGSWVVKGTKWKGSRDIKQRFSPNVVPRPLAIVASCHLIRHADHQAHPRPTESET